MTNKEFRSDLAKEMRDKYKKRNEQLEQIDKLPITKETKESARKDIMDNFNQEMEEMKTRPGYAEARQTHLAEIQAKIKLAKSKKEKERLQKEYEEKLAKADEDIAKSKKGYEDAQIAHNRWKIEQKTAENKENIENIEIPQKLKDFREKWKKNINLDEDIKKKIIDAVNTIQKWAREEPDWSIWVKFELWWEAYKTLDVNVAKHSDKKYLTSYKYNWQEKNEVKLWWMRWDDTSQRKNRTLADYVDSEKNKRGIEIKTVEIQKDLISKLWDEAGLTDMGDKIAMWMYLTWNYWYYWWTMWNHEKSNPAGGSRSRLCCLDFGRYFFCRDDDGNHASLCMIACE